MHQNQRAEFKTWIGQLEFCGHSTVQIMNALQGAGIISDLCIEPADIADADLPRAIKFLKGHNFK